MPRSSLLWSLPNHDGLHPWTVSQSKHKLLLLGLFSLQWETQLTSISILRLEIFPWWTPRQQGFQPGYIMQQAIKGNWTWDWSQTKSPTFQELSMVYYIDNPKPRGCDSLFGPQWEKAVNVLAESGHLPACSRCARADKDGRGAGEQIWVSQQHYQVHLISLHTGAV